ncbi:hypothetical protein L0F81_03290 [Streptomyces tricolor]|uniref:Transposase n=1 Tax=Streptomyces tricolor TaxID=68277 RepID=A0ABS9J9V6_9ACTN|nr:hypothetical protein [Streptomyces tricolor]MCG0062323.1 hypothetical protein [Streptomyces tricolor]
MAACQLVTSVQGQWQLKKPENRCLLSTIRAAGRRRMTGTYWLLLLTTEREVFGSRRGQRAGKFYEVLEQMLASTCRRLPAGPRKSPPPTDRRTASSEEVPRSYIGSGDGRPLLAARRSGTPQAPRSLGDG